MIIRTSVYGPYAKVEDGYVVELGYEHPLKSGAVWIRGSKYVTLEDELATQVRSLSNIYYYDKIFRAAYNEKLPSVEEMKDLVIKRKLDVSKDELKNAEEALEKAQVTLEKARQSHNKAKRAFEKRKSIRNGRRYAR